MKNFKILFLAILLVSCKKTEIKQLKIDFTTGTYGIIQFVTSSAAGEIFEKELIYLGFNKNNYVGCESIIFTGCLGSNLWGNQCFLELYNLTDSTVISNSTISASSGIHEWIESQNLLKYFPDKDIDLTLKLRTEDEGTTVFFTSASIYINF